MHSCCSKVWSCQPLLGCPASFIELSISAHSLQAGLNLTAPSHPPELQSAETLFQWLERIVPAIWLIPRNLWLRRKRIEVHQSKLCIGDCLLELLQSSETKLQTKTVQTCSNKEHQIFLFRSEYHPAPSQPFLSFWCLVPRQSNEVSAVSCQALSIAAMVSKPRELSSWRRLDPKQGKTDSTDRQGLKRVVFGHFYVPPHAAFKKAFVHKLQLQPNAKGTWRLEAVALRTWRLFPTVFLWRW